MIADGEDRDGSVEGANTAEYRNKQKMTCRKAESKHTLKKPSDFFFQNDHAQKIRLYPGEGSKCVIPASVLPLMCKDRISKTFITLDKVAAEV